MIANNFYLRHQLIQTEGSVTILNTKLIALKEANRNLREQIIKSVSFPSNNSLVANRDKDRLEDGYYGWILQHSTKCPKSIAKQIAHEAVMTNGGLILLALIARESSFNPFLRSSANARGLGQIRPFFVKKGKKVDVWENELKEQGIIETPRDLYDPIINFRATSYIFQKQYQSVGENVELALYKYLGQKNKQYVFDILRNIGDLVCYLKLAT